MKEFLGVITIILAVVGTIPYIIDIFKGKTKPHLFSWILWTLSTILVFFGQVQKGAGAGAWGTGVIGTISILITLLTIKRGSKDITKSDKLLFALSLIAIIPWFLTKDPTISVVILTGVNAAAGSLTIRKTLNHPESESLILYVTNILRHSLTIAAIANYNLATYIFPGVLLIVNIIMVSIILKPRTKQS